MRTPLIIATLAVGLVACRNDSPQTPPLDQGTPAQQSAQQGTPAPQQGEQASPSPDVQPVKEVVKDPTYGERITVEGKVDTVYGPQHFTMKAGIFRDELLVVAPKQLVSEAFSTTDDVRITGTVRKMVVSEVEREFTLDFDNAAEVKWEAKPYLVAESMERVPD